MEKPPVLSEERIPIVHRRVGRKVFEFVRTEDGTVIHCIRQDAPLLEVTNWEVDAPNALTSRYHTITVPLARVPVRELRCHPDVDDDD